MGKLKRKMVLIHKRKVKKSKEKLKSLGKKQISYDKLGKVEKRIFNKKVKAGYRQASFKKESSA